MPQGAGSFLIAVFGTVSSLGIILVLNVVNTILNIALYVYANTVEEPGTFTINVWQALFNLKAKISKGWIEKSVGLNISKSLTKVMHS